MVKEITPKKSFTFGTFRLDGENECLWRGDEEIPLTPKDFAVLLYLVENPGRLISKDELVNAIWPETFVGDGILKVSIRKIRKAVGDDPSAPKFIETLHRRGYRFIGNVSEVRPTVRPRRLTAYEPIEETKCSASTIVVGRERELAKLDGWLQRALRGEREVVFVVGEAGIGKTTLVETFLNRATVNHGLSVARGQCLEQYGECEPYMPMLEAFSRLCSEPGREYCLAVLARHAPTWLLQMPWLISDDEHESLRRKAQGATRARMLREMTEAITAITAEEPLVLVLEDMHWSDYSTLDLISSLARRHERARLLIIATYRPVDVILKNHPLKAIRQELDVHQQCEELPLDFLTEASVAEYLAVRFPTSQLCDLAHLIHQRTDGNPLFMTNVMDYLLARSLVVQQGGEWQISAKAFEEVSVAVPESVRRMIEKHLDHLSAEEQSVLSTASAIGMDFSVAAIAAALKVAVIQVDDCCDALVRRSQFLHRLGIKEYPDGTITTRYCFTHNLYQTALYERLPSTRRVQLHQLIGEYEELAHGERAGEIAAELASHFERGSDSKRAVHYLLRAARNAVARFAHREAVALLTKSLGILKASPDDIDCARHELEIQTALGTALISTNGPAAPEVEQAYTRARELCEMVGDTRQLFMILRGLWAFHNLLHAPTATRLGEELLRVAQLLNEPALQVNAHGALGWNLTFRGEFANARTHLNKAIVPYDSEQHHARSVIYGMDPEIMSRCHSAVTLWCLGYPDQALMSCREAIDLTPQPCHPFTRAGSFIYTAAVHQLRGESEQTSELAEKAVALSTEHGLPFWKAAGTILLGTTISHAGKAVEVIQEGLADYQTTGALLMQPWCFALLAEAQRREGHFEDGLRALADAMAVADRSGEYFYQAELYRLRGELLLALDETKIAEAERCFHQSLEVARRQQAKSFELRTTISLARLNKVQGRKREAVDRLRTMYSWLTEGLETADLREARSLMDSLT